MTSRLITTWSEYDRAVQELLDLAPRVLQIFDQDLSPLKLERAQRIAALRELLATREDDKRLTIIVQNADFVRQYSPQLLQLLRVFAPALTIIQSPAHLATLQDSLLIADGRHALSRFQRDHARARLIVDDASECAPYVLRFDEILATGGDPLSPTTLGL